MTIYSDHQPSYSTLSDHVEAMIAEYEATKEPSHGLQYIRDDSRLYSSFCDIIKNHIGLIMSRPQAIEDGHITVYDKCLLELCRDGQYVDGLAGQEFFIREYMGVNPQARLRMDVEEMIERGISVSGKALKYRQTRARPERPHIKEEKEAITTLPQVTSENQPYRETVFAAYATVFHPDMTVNTNINRMLHTYFRAKHDFYTRQESARTVYDPKLADAAKFLRDSAENALGYLDAQKLLSSCDSSLVLELESVFEFAKSKAIEILGGRKRRFEVESFYSDGGSSSGTSNKVWVTERPKMPRKHHSIDRYTSASADSWYPYAGGDTSRSVRRRS